MSNCDISLLLNGPKERKNTRCTECDGTTFVEDTVKGIIICNCGQTIGTMIDTNDETPIRDTDDGFRNGLYYNVLLPQSSLGTQLNASGRLKKISLWSAMPFRERSDLEIFNRIHKICKTHKISKKIEFDAKILFKSISSTAHTSGKNTGKPIITRGYNRAGIVAGCVFIACRRNDETRAIKEVAYYFSITEKDVNKGLRSMQTILKDNFIKDNSTSKVIHFIRRKCDELHIKNVYTDIAYTIAVNVDRLNFASNHTSYSLAAACILLMLDITEQTHVSKKNISSVFFGLSDVTIGKTYNQLKLLKTLLTDNKRIDSIITEINESPHNTRITQSIYNKMEQFGVDTSSYVVII